MARLLAPLLLLAVATGCDLRPSILKHAVIRYEPTGVCQKFSIATLTDRGFSLQTAPPDLKHIGFVRPNLPPLEIDAPTQTTEYSFFVGGQVETNVPLSLAFRCLPDKPAVRVDFVVPIVDFPSIRVRVRETASKPEGLEITVEQFRYTPPPP